jgi:hypothetical protein
MYSDRYSPIIFANDDDGPSPAEWENCKEEMGTLSLSNGALKPPASQGLALPTHIDFLN